MTSSSTSPTFTRAVRWLYALAHGLLLAWALAWAIVLASGAAEGMRDDTISAMLLILLLGSLVAAAWCHPLLGGLLLLATGIEEVLVPALDSTRLSLGLSASILGLLYVVLPRLPSGRPEMFGTRAAT